MDMTSRERAALAMNGREEGKTGTNGRRRQTVPRGRTRTLKHPRPTNLSQLRAGGIPSWRRI
jgi:hypothetical protein